MPEWRHERSRDARRLDGATTGAPSLLRLARDRWGQFRARWWANPAFRQFASSFPLTRPVARRRTRAPCSIWPPASSTRRFWLPSSGWNLVTFLNTGPTTLAQIADKDGIDRRSGLEPLCGQPWRSTSPPNAPTAAYRLGEAGAALVGK